MSRLQLYDEMAHAYELARHADHWQSMHREWFAAARDALEQSTKGDE